VRLFLFLILFLCRVAAIDFVVEGLLPILFDLHGLSGVILQLQLFLPILLLASSHFVHGILKELEHDSQEHVEKHGVADEHGRNEEDDGDDFLVRVLVDYRAHHPVPIFTGQHNKHSDHAVKCRVEVVARNFAFQVNHITIEVLLSDEGVNEEEEER